MAVTIIAVDGPGGAGKGTLCRRLASRFGFHYLDSGALYRLLAYRIGELGAADEDAAKIAASLRPEFALDSNQILLDGVEVGARLRDESIAAAASRIAVRPDVREALLDLQRQFARTPGLVADGRDMGTVVFPQAQLKIFLDASAQERAQRRHKELIDSGKSANFEKIFRDVCSRDERDRNRTLAPLRPAVDAVVLDSTARSIDSVFEAAVAEAASRGIE